MTVTPTPTAKPIRMVQVGAGGMGRTWLRALRESADVALVGLVDLDVDLARWAAEEAGLAGLPVAGSLGRLPEVAQARAVLNVTVPAAHHAVTTDALRRGLAVLSEKPLAESVAEGLSMAAAAEASGQLMMVAQSRRYWRQLSAYRRQIAGLGPVASLSCEFAKGVHFGGFREQMAYPLLVDMAIHHFDLARDLLHSDPVAVYCESYNPAWSWFAGDAAATAVFEFAGGERFSYVGSWCSPGVETSWNGRWRLSAAGGSAIWDGDSAPVAEPASGTSIDSLLINEPEGIAGSLAEFVQALRTGSVPWGEVHSNVLSLAMVQAAIASATQRRRVLLAEVLDDAYAEVLRSETHNDVRAVLQAWPAVHEAVGIAARRLG